MNDNDQSLFELAERILKTPIERIPDAQRETIRRALHRHRNPLKSSELLDEGLKWHERLADNVARIGGSWRFIIAFGLSLASWAALNSWLLSRPFDPYPYIFLNLLLSMLAAVQAPLIMMSQNRQAAHDRRQAQRDFEINLKAELEILALHEKLDRLIDRVAGRLQDRGSGSPA